MEEQPEKPRTVLCDVRAAAVAAGSPRLDMSRPYVARKHPGCVPRLGTRRASETEDVAMDAAQRSREVRVREESSAGAAGFAASRQEVRSDGHLIWWFSHLISCTAARRNLDSCSARRDCSYFSLPPSPRASRDGSHTGQRSRTRYTRYGCLFPSTFRPFCASGVPIPARVALF